MDAETVYENVVAWTSEYDPEFNAVLTKDPQYAKDILSIGRGGSKPRKDFGLWKEVREYMGFFYNELFDGHSSQMSLLVHLIKQTTDIGKKLLLVLSDVGILFDTERAGGVATVGNF